MVASVSAAVVGDLATAPSVAQLSDWRFVAQNVPYLLGGTLMTIALTIVSILLGFAVGLPAGAVEVYGEGWLQRAVEVFGVVLRGTPIVVILMFAYFVFPVPSAFLAGVLGLGLRSAAYQTQIFRGSIQSVSEGQMEAARAVGMDSSQAIRHVILPQALRRSVPGFQNEATIVLKDTSVVFAIGLSELLTRSYDLFVRQTTAVLEVILFASAIYFVLTFATNRALDYAQAYYAIPSGESA